LIDTISFFRIVKGLGSQKWSQKNVFLLNENNFYDVSPILHLTLWSKNSGSQLKSSQLHVSRRMSES